MKPESAAFLRKAREFLAKAAFMLDDWPDEAGRAAYLAGLHGAQALIVERTNKIAKSHRGVQRELARLTRDEPDFDSALRAFLGRAYNLKAIADYDTGEARVVIEQAREAIQTATRLIETVAGMLPPNGPALQAREKPKSSG
ncbi:MAG: HEPN domain-containing protein [Stellaceae bacterium]